MWLPLLLVALPLAEIAVLIVVGGWIGLWPTLGLVVAGFLLGFLLVRSVGLFTMAEVQTAIHGARDPGEPLVRGAFLFVAAILFMIPGFLTDLAGAALLFPALQRMIVRRLLDGMEVTGSGPTGGAHHRFGSGIIVDAEYHEVVESDDPVPGRELAGSRRRGRTEH